MEAKDLQSDPFAVAIEPSWLSRRSLSGTFATAASQIGKFVVQFGSQIILARLLFPGDFGLIAMAYPVIGFIQIFNDIGLGQAIVQRPTLSTQQVSALFWVNLLAGSSLAMVALIVAPVSAWVYHEPRVLPLIVALGLTFPISALGIVPSSLLSRHMKFWLLARNEIITLVAGTAAVLACALAGMAYWSIVIGQAVGAVLNVLLLWSATAWRPSKPAIVASTWSDLRFGGNLTLANLATFAITSGDNLIVGLTSGRLSLGLYDRSYGLVVQPLSQLTAPMSRTALPLLSRLMDQPIRYCQAYLTLFRAMAFATMPAMVVCIVDGQEVIALFLGPKWVAAGPIFRWISVGGLTSAFYSTASWLFVSQDRASEMRLYTFVCAAINVLSFIIGAFWGVTGIAACAALVFVLVTTPIMLFGATRSGPVLLCDIRRATGPFVVETLIASLSLYCLRLVHFAAFVSLVVATLTAYGCYFLVAQLDGPQSSLLRAGVRGFYTFFVEKMTKAEG